MNEVLLGDRVADEMEEVGEEEDDDKGKIEGNGLLD
jgi:hypothetical protein